jgi:ketosteroid isomerase-like protein
MSGDNRVQQFITLLQQIERTRQVDPILDLFAQDAQISTISQRKPLVGKAGVKQFWTGYLAIFRTVGSEFVHQHATADLAVLEWRSEGVLHDGAAINYQGVSILEFSGEKIGRFRTYYDSAAFLPDGAKLLGREVEV